MIRFRSRWPSAGDTRPSMVRVTSWASGKVWSNRRADPTLAEATGVASRNVGPTTCTLLGKATTSLCWPYPADTRSSVCRMNVTG